MMRRTARTDSVLNECRVGSTHYEIEHAMVYAAPQPRAPFTSFVLPSLIALFVMSCAFLLGCGPSRDDRLAEIRALQAEGRVHETVSAVMELFVESPDDPEMMRLQGLTMLQTGNPTLAVWPLRTLSEHAEGGIDEHLLLARALRTGGASREAFDTITEVMEAQPDHVEGLMLYAGLAIEVKDHEAALSSSDALLRIDPRLAATAHVWKAKALIGLDRFEEADQAIEVAVKTLSARPDAATWRATLCKTSVEVAEAEAKRNEVDAATDIETGTETDTETEPKADAKTQERWETCLLQFPVNIEIIAPAIKFFDENQERARANAILERAIEVAPNHIDFRFRLAKRLAAERRESEGEEILLELTHADTESADSTFSAWLAVADYHRNLSHFEKAVQAAEQAISGQESISVLLVAQIADDCIQARMFERAEELISTIGTPEYASLLRGRMALAQGDPHKARVEILEGLRRFQGNAAARYLAAQAAAQMGDLDVAIQEYRDAVRSGPGQSDAAFELARLYEAEGNFRGAHHILGMRRLKLPEDLRVHEQVAMLSIRYMNKEGAQRAVDAIDKLPGQRVAAVLAQARLEARHDGPAEAVAVIMAQTATREMDLTQPENEEVLRELVRYLARSERAVEGLAKAREAVVAHPEFAAFQEILAAALIQAEQPSEEIEKAWARALELDPKSQRALGGQAKLAAESEQIDKALKLYDLAAEADPENLSAVSAAGWSALQLVLDAEREDEVDERLEILLRKNPIHPRAVNLLARRLLEDGTDLDRAEKLAVRANRYAGSAEALETLGLVSLERGENLRALRAFRTALKRRPESPSLRYQLARALIANGNQEAAAEALRRALEGDDFPEASEARDQLARLDVEQEQVDVDE